MILWFPPIFPFICGRHATEIQYLLRGLHVRHGCNAGAYHAAGNDIRLVERLLEWHNCEAPSDTNLVMQLQTALRLAREERDVIDEDCRRRFHCHTHPWKAEWNVIRPTIESGEKRVRDS